MKNIKIKTQFLCSLAELPGIIFQGRHCHLTTELTSSSVEQNKACSTVCAERNVVRD
jgi:hypothetical protein